MGAYVQLLEYDNIEGMILLSELTRRRIRSVSKLIKVRGLPVLNAITNFANSGWPGRASHGASRGRREGIY
jgi:hypothetical protein